jgi:hypothetical protein
VSAKQSTRLLRCNCWELTVVGSTFAELDGTEKIGDGRDLAGDTAKSSEFLVGRLAIVIFPQDGNISSSMAMVLLDVDGIVETNVLLLGHVGRGRLDMSLFVVRCIACRGSAGARGHNEALASRH